MRIPDLGGSTLAVFFACLSALSFAVLCLMLWAWGYFWRPRMRVRGKSGTPSGLLADLAGLTGCALVSWGTWQIYAPAGYIVGGVLLIAGSFLFARAGASSAPPAPE